MFIGLSIITPNTWALDIFHLYPLTGEAVFNVDLFRSKGGRSQTDKGYALQERFSIRDGGYILHPGILSFNLDVKPTFSQQVFKSQFDDAYSSARVLNYSANVGILQGLPYNLNLRGARDSGTLNSSRGSRTEFQTNRFSVGGIYRNYYLPLKMSYSKRFIKQTETSGFTSAVSDRDDVEENMSFSANNSKIDLSLERLKFEDRMTDRVFTSNKGKFTHRLLRWGKGSSLDYDIDYLKKEGLSTSRRLASSERLHLQHTKNLYTTYSHYYSSQTRDTDIKTNSGAFSLNHQLYRNLKTRVNLSASSTNSESSRRFSYGGGLNLSYAKRLPWNGRFTAGLGRAYRIFENENPGVLFEVADEEHEVNFTRFFILKRRFIVADSVVITNPNETILYIQGQDFDLISRGGLTEIIILTGGRIIVGDVLRVGYDYESSPARKLSVTTLNYRAGLNFGWVNLYYTLSRSEQDLYTGGSGDPLGFIEESITGVNFKFNRPAYTLTLATEKRSEKTVDFGLGALTSRQSLSEDFATEMELKFNRPAYTLTLAAEAARIKTGDFKLSSINLRQVYRRNYASGISFSLSANQTYIKSEKRESVDLNEALSLDWRPIPNLFLELNAEMSWRRETREGNKSEQSFWKVGPKLRYFLGKVEINAEYYHMKWGGTLIDRAEDRLTFNIKRRF